MPGAVAPASAACSSGEGGGRYSGRRAGIRLVGPDVARIGTVPIVGGDRPSPP